MRPRKLLSVAHSYAVALNRRLAHELALAGGDRWDVTMLAPNFFQGDLRPLPLQYVPGEPGRLVALPAYLTRFIHVFFYGTKLRALLKEGWDLVHCWEEPYILAGPQVAWWTPERTPLVYASYQNLNKRYPPPFNWFEQYSLHRAAGCIVGGRTGAETLRERPGYRNRPLQIIPMGVDTDVFHPDAAAGALVRQSLGWEPGGPPVIGSLGRFVPEKGLALLMKVLDALSHSWRALLVGTGPLEPEVRAWAARHGERVCICTGVTHDEVPRYLNAMDVLCVPSQTTPRWREQFGRVLIEAFACGVAVVGSDSGEIPYVVGDAGLVVGENDEVGWHQALTGLLGNPARRQELAARGLERAHSRYAWRVIARQHLDFFEEVVARRAALGEGL